MRSPRALDLADKRRQLEAEEAELEDAEAELDLTHQQAIRAPLIALLGRYLALHDDAAHGRCLCALCIDTANEARK